MNSTYFSPLWHVNKVLITNPKKTIREAKPSCIHGVVTGQIHLMASSLHKGCSANNKTGQPATLQLVTGLHCRESFKSLRILTVIALYIQAAVLHTGELPTRAVSSTYNRHAS
ncbi:hypothetical protein J6590_056097 [Homalodisca vitripennis]|nr:hypothetical protein J6590_056097 [Homalodisca vitripennis]